ncbi:MAG: hypothetical protein AB9872_00215 [Solidesulfovibrio sp.]
MKPSTIILVVFLVSCSMVSIAEAMPRDIDTKMAEIVVKHMVRRLPATIKKICVMEEDRSKSSDAEGMFYKFKNIDPKIDKRIVQDPMYCDGQRGGKLVKSILYYGEASKDEIDRVLGPDESGWKETVDLNSFRELRKYISQGYVVVSSSIDGCGVGVFGFVFKCTSVKIELVRVLKIGTVICLKKNE